MNQSAWVIHFVAGGAILAFLGSLWLASRERGGSGSEPSWEPWTLLVAVLAIPCGYACWALAAPGAGPWTTGGLVAGVFGGYLAGRRASDSSSVTLGLLGWPVAVTLELCGQMPQPGAHPSIAAAVCIGSLLPGLARMALDETGSTLGRQGLLYAGSLAVTGTLVTCDRSHPLHLVGLLEGASALMAVICSVVASRHLAADVPRHQALTATGGTIMLATPLFILSGAQLPDLLPLAGGLITGAMLRFLIMDEATPAERWTALLASLGIGASLVLANRLWGIAGVALWAVGILPLCALLADWLIALPIQLAGMRTMLQVLLDSSYLHHEGVNILQSYVLAGVAAGGIMAVAATLWRPAGRAAGVLLACLVCLLPLVVGHILHLQPLAGFLAGGMLAVLLMPVTLGRNSLALLALAWASCAGILALPFWVAHLDANRWQRGIPGVVLALGILACGWLASRPQRSPRV